jgi:ribonuclease HI
MSQPALTISTDGASRGNPGAAAYAYVIENGDETIEEAERLPDTTNNQAEYTALVKALEHAAELGTDRAVRVRSDSELMVKQMRGEYRVKNEDLRPLYEQAVRLARRFAGGVTYTHVRRELNKRADQLCNEALDGKRLPSVRGLVATVKATTPVPPAPVVGSLRQQAVACLRRAAAAWSAGAASPTPDEVWDELEALRQQHRAARKAAEGGK